MLAILTITAVGVAKPKAQGHEITKHAIPNMSEKVASPSSSYHSGVRHQSYRVRTIPKRLPPPRCRLWERKWRRSCPPSFESGPVEFVAILYQLNNLSEGCVGANAGNSEPRHHQTPCRQYLPTLDFRAFSIWACFPPSSCFHRPSTRPYIRPHQLAMTRLAKS
jgi:hypothetical protein